MSGGLDALETLGKKTMEVLTEGDPGSKMATQYLELCRISGVCTCSCVSTCRSAW